MSAKRHVDGLTLSSVQTFADSQGSRRGPRFVPFSCEPNQCLSNLVAKKRRPYLKTTSSTSSKMSNRSYT